MDVRVKLEQINPLEGYGHPFLWKDRMKNETERSDKNNNIVQETSVAQDIVQLLLKIAFIVLAVFLIFTFLYGIVRINDVSMKPAIKDGSEDRLKSLIPDRLPEEIQKAYENAHR